MTFTDQGRLQILRPGNKPGNATATVVMGAGANLWSISPTASSRPGSSVGVSEAEFHVTGLAPGNAVLRIRFHGNFPPSNTPTQDLFRIGLRIQR